VILYCFLKREAAPGYLREEVHSFLSDVLNMRRGLISGRRFFNAIKETMSN